MRACVCAHQCTCFSTPALAGSPRMHTVPTYTHTYIRATFEVESSRRLSRDVGGIVRPSVVALEFWPRLRGCEAAARPDQTETETKREFEIRGGRQSSRPVPQACTMRFEGFFFLKKKNRRYRLIFVSGVG
ncbi:hypothetical protein BS50DRAFT_578413 [Corynespora cassiicola Philippines]|uniref:Uncharacterized protein n=1 Tax=Corynespora cassiicola Philippines TaxID=1448308 RepID=A0A2T2N7K0_CORCC|nr:hypothetical protein BS50DRAFT_578413 [Corynespora cassiicola Philippines]